MTCPTLFLHFPQVVGSRDGTAMTQQALPTLGARLGPGDRAAVEVIAFGPGHERARLGPHLHEDLELMYFAEGNGTDQLGNRRFEVGPGDILLVTPGIVHDASGLGSARGWALEFGVGASGRSGGNTAEVVVGLWWSNPLLTPFVAAGERRSFARFHVPDADQPRWRARLAAMEHEQRQRSAGYDDAISAYLLITLVELARLAAPYTAGLRQQGHELLASVFEVIDERFRDRLSTVDVAAAVGLTPGYLTTLVRERTGRTVLDWITERRMAEARALLLNTPASAEQVAAAVGYGDAAYFNRRFRSHHGRAPGAWRAASRPAR